MLIKPNIVLYELLFHKKLYFYKTSKVNEMKSYWKTNLRYLLILLSIWFLVSFGAGILFRDLLDTIKIGGFKLGFWFAQQGSIYVFVILIFVYVRLMNKLDKKFGYDDESAQEQNKTDKQINS